MTWNRLPAAGADTPVTTANSLPDCQAACAADDGCQLFEWSDYPRVVGGAPGVRCGLRRAAERLGSDAGAAISEAGRYAVLFEGAGAVVIDALAAADALKLADRIPYVCCVLSMSPQACHSQHAQPTQHTNTHS